MFPVRKAATVIVARMHPEGMSEVEGPAEDATDDLEGLADDFLKAVEAKDAAGVASAFKAMFAACDTEPQEEYDEEA